MAEYSCNQLPPVPVATVLSDIAATNKKAGVIGIIGGIFLLIAGAIGAYILIMEPATQKMVFPENESLQIMLIILLALTFIAVLSGIVVTIGSVMIMRSKVGLGKFIVGLGAGMGMLGLIIVIVLPLWQSGLTALLVFMQGLLTFQGLGVVLSIVAWVMAKKPDGSHIMPRTSVRGP